jgi:hypothetical protein
MKESDMSNTSRTDWSKIDAMTDDDIDKSDIPPLTDEFFSKAKLRMPSSPLPKCVNQPNNPAKTD